MNPRTVTVNIKKCAVCDYDMSDAHHVYPKRLGGKVTVNLCPNHHRAANLLQLAVATEVKRGTNFDMTVNYARMYFDKAFNTIVTYLIDAYVEEEARTVDRAFGGPGF